jgi:hypothetical protein
MNAMSPNGQLVNGLDALRRHMADFGYPVEIRGLRIEPGGILHGDCRGVLSAPPELVDRFAVYRRTDPAGRVRAIRINGKPTPYRELPNKIPRFGYSSFQHLTVS